MEKVQVNKTSSYIHFSVKKNGQEIARAFLYLIYNGLHSDPYGLLEDLFVDESFRGQGIGTGLVVDVIAAAKDNNCYKLLATSRSNRPKVHTMYRKLGFEEYGKEFRMNLS